MDPNQPHQPIQNLNQTLQDLTQQPQKSEKPQGRFSKYKIWLFVVVILATLILFSIFLGLFFLDETNNEMVIQEENKTPIIGSSELTSFQELLRDQCQDTPGGEELIVGVRIEDLPIKFDNEILERTAIDKKEIILCQKEYVETYGYVGLALKLTDEDFEEVYSMYIHDKQSEEPDHGGPRFLNTDNNVIRDDDNVKIAIFFDNTFGGALPDEISIGELVIKKIVLKNGEEIFVSFIHPLVDSGNSKLLEIISKYSVPAVYENYPEFVGRVFIEDYDAAYNEVISDILNDPNNLDESIASNLNQVNTILSAINTN